MFCYLVPALQSPVSQTCACARAQAAAAPHPLGAFAGCVFGLQVAGWYIRFRCVLRSPLVIGLLGSLLRPSGSCVCMCKDRGPWRCMDTFDLHYRLAAALPRMDF